MGCESNLIFNLTYPYKYVPNLAGTTLPRPAIELAPITGKYRHLFLAGLIITKFKRVSIYRTMQIIFFGLWVFQMIFMSPLISSTSRNTYYLAIKNVTIEAEILTNITKVSFLVSNSKTTFLKVRLASPGCPRDPFRWYRRSEIFL